MLVSLQAWAADAAGSWQLLATGETSAEAASSHLRPEDPSTLTLALIGAVTMAVYLAVRRGRRDQGVMQIEAVQASAALPEIAAVEATASEQPSRGAA
jgi:hypothetical protein